MKKYVKSSSDSNSLLDEFMRYHEDPDNYEKNRDGFDKVYSILDKYGTENENVDEVFVRAPENVQRRMIELIKPKDKKSIRKYIGSSSNWPYWVEGDNDTDVVVFFYDEDLECYRGEGDIVASIGDTLKEAVYNAKQIAKNYDRYVYDRVKFKESIDYNETDLDSLGELKIFWHTR